MVVGSFMKGQPLVTKLATVAKFGVFPGAMIAALVYSPPDYIRPNKTTNPNSK